MNRRDIPGFYWDESKQKYFKVQANHLAPQGAKYAKENIQQEKRTKKKRKVAIDQQLRKEKQTVRRSHILTFDAIGGIGIQREHGSYLTSSKSAVQENALISQAICERVEVKFPGLSEETGVQDAHYVPETEQMVIASGHAYGGVSAVYVSNWEWEVASGDACVRVPPYGIAAFNSKVATISTSKDRFTPRVLACAERHQAGNVFMGLISPDHVEETASPGIYLTLGEHGSSINDSCIHPATGVSAVIGSCGIFIIDHTANVVNSQPKSVQPYGLEWPQCEPCINWLGPHTVVYGAKAEERGYNVMLWDTRTPDGKAPRFDVRERLTGVFNPTKFGQNGLGDEHQIVASTNRRIDLFDTRMPRLNPKDSPILSFKHVHGGPRLSGAAYGDLLAAVDLNNVAQVYMYSLRSGSMAGTLSAGGWIPKRYQTPALRQLMWYDDTKDGPMLQAVRGNGVVGWAWTDRQSDDEDA